MVCLVPGISLDGYATFTVDKGYIASLYYYHHFLWTPLPVGVVPVVKNAKPLVTEVTCNDSDATLPDNLGISRAALRLQISFPL